MIKNSESERKLELVSLIDVVFLLLIFFIITTSVLSRKEGEDKIQAKLSVDIPNFSEDAGHTLIDAYLFIKDLPNEIFLVESSNLVQANSDGIESTEKYNIAGIHKKLNDLQPQRLVLCANPDILLRELSSVLDACKQYSQQIIFSMPRRGKTPQTIREGAPDDRTEVL